MLNINLISVAGLGCNKNEDCSVDLPNAKCDVTDIGNKVCICLKEDDCNGMFNIICFSLFDL